jgi:hypothetical protein
LVAVSTNPLQRTTGCGGYFAKRGSFVDNRHNKNIEPFPDVITFTFAQRGHKPPCERGARGPDDLDPPPASRPPSSSFPLMIRAARA